MTITIRQVLSEVSVSESEVVTWIERRWVLPSGNAGHYRFDETDCARIRLIAELKNDLEVDDQSMPLVLSLLDQVYALRRTLGSLQEVLDELPEELRREIDAALSKTAKF